MKSALKAGLLCAAQAFFLWMFFSTQGLERLADAGACSGGAAATVRITAYRYAAEWRHGLSGGWPVYVPGFFIAAAVTWFWSFGRSVRKLAPECAAVMTVATVAALAASPAGLRAVLLSFSVDQGIACRGRVPPPEAAPVAIAVYTLVAWIILVLSCHRALWRRKYWPLVFPVIADAVLIAVRPFTFGDLMTTWFNRAKQGEPIALASFALIPAISLVMVWGQLAWERRQHRAQAARSA